MNNPMSSNGVAEELIRTFIQFGCAELHAKTLLEKNTSKLDNGLIDVTNSEILNAKLSEVEELTKDIEMYAELRRDSMRKLYSLFPDDELTDDEKESRKSMWCTVKHLGVGMFTAFEAYEATDNDVDLYNLYLQANKAFIRAVTRFIGVEITECSSCFGDMLKGEKINAENVLQSTSN